ncbi:MAG: hypothetical protein AAB575_03680, partial [Patescibacteria group bacterium]
MKKSFVFFLVMICLCVCGCKKIDTFTTGQCAETPAVVKPVDVGSGLYYFDNSVALLGKTLEPFIKAHPELELVSMAPFVT